MAGGRTIITVIRFIPFPIHFVVCGVIIIVIVGTIKEGTTVMFLYGKDTWVALCQSVHSVKYVLQERKRREVLAIKPSSGAKTYKVLRTLCVACRTECNGIRNKGLHCVVVCFVHLCILPNLYSSVFCAIYRHPGDDI